MELMVRLGAMWVMEVYGYGKSLSDHLDEFLRIYVSPLYDETTMYDHRTLIRGNKFLNKLLHDNNSGLRSIYERSKNDLSFFTIKSSLDVFLQLKHPDYQVTPKII